MNVLTFPHLAEFERRYRDDHKREHALLLDRHGLPVLTRAGDVDSVSFDPAELERARGGTLSHNHPRCLPASGPDVFLAAEYGLTLRAYGTAPDTGQIFDYTLRMLSGSEHYAAAIRAVFDDVLEQAEIELAHEPYGDLQWQRESRHLALKRLARRFGFIYQRAEKAIPVSEATSRERRRLDSLAEVEQVMRREVFEPLHAAIVRSLTRRAVQDHIPIQAMLPIQTEISAQVQQTMLGHPDRSGALAPYDTRHGEVIPRSVYFATLWQLMKRVAGLAIDYHAGLMKRFLPDDLIRAFQMATISPFEEVSEAAVPDPFFVGPDGKELSDRIWNATGDMRRKLMAYLSNAIASGKGVPQIALELESYLLPGVQHRRIPTPFGNFSFEAMRLARTQVAYAYAQADWQAAQGNPFVEGYRLVTAPQHQCCDECDLVEAGGPYPKDDTTHLAPRHPNCICSVIWVIVQDVKAVLAALQDEVQRAISAATKAITDVIGPLSRRFLDVLFRRGR